MGKIIPIFQGREIYMIDQRKTWATGKSGHDRSRLTKTPQLPVFFIWALRIIGFGKKKFGQVDF